MQTHLGSMTGFPSCLCASAAEKSLNASTEVGNERQPGVIFRGPSNPPYRDLSSIGPSSLIFFYPPSFLLSSVCSSSPRTPFPSCIRELLSGYFLRRYGTCTTSDENPLQDTDLTQTRSYREQVKIARICHRVHRMLCEIGIMFRVFARLKILCAVLDATSSQLTLS